MLTALPAWEQLLTNFDVHLLYNPLDVVVDLLAIEKAGTAYCNRLIVA